MCVCGSSVGLVFRRRVEEEEEEGWWMDPFRQKKCPTIFLSTRCGCYTEREQIPACGPASNGILGGITGERSLRCPRKKGVFLWRLERLPLSQSFPRVSLPFHFTHILFSPFFSVMDIGHERWRGKKRRKKRRGKRSHISISSKGRKKRGNSDFTLGQLSTLPITWAFR